jgi:hypothetical protein
MTDGRSGQTIRRRRLRAIAVAGVVISCGAATGTAAPRVRQPPDAQWQYQLQGAVDRSNPARVFDVDGASTPQATVRALQHDGRYVVCYFSAGTYERFRSDSRRLPASVRGRPVGGFPDERWLDIRRLGAIAPVLRARMQTCARKGFDAVEPDNVDGYQNRTGFPLRRSDALRFTRWLARTAHGLGLAVGLKNSAGLVSSLAGRFDFAVVEQCLQYDECDRYVPFVRRGKPVYEVEYEGAPQTICPAARRLGFNTILKTVDLDAPSRPCPGRA